MKQTKSVLARLLEIPLPEDKTREEPERTIR
jgi:hypothetical protein